MHIQCTTHTLSQKLFITTGNILFKTIQDADK